MNGDVESFGFTAAEEALYARARRLSIRLVALADARNARKPADAALN